jgi:pyruvate dehydrogenase E2 component (dihydrolipoamide acetyltransferase)
MATTDFVMPKLGLTMTEGVVARWDVAQGSRFAAGDIILVVETDKIAYDIEAPAPGILQEVLVSAGSAVPVGTPIGRWDVGDIKISLDAPGTEAAAELLLAPFGAETPLVLAATPPRSEGERVLATPFARRLARQAGIDLRSLNGTGPGGRIKAADIERAIAAARSTMLPAAARTVPDEARAAVHSAGVEIDVTGLLALNAQINNALPGLAADLTHYVVLAAAKIPDIFAKPTVIGLAQSRESGGGMVSILAGTDCRTLRSVIAHIGSSAALSDASALQGTLWIERALDGISYFVADPPRGWPASLNIGSVREAFRPDADGRPVPAALVDVVLTCRAADLDPGSAQRLLRRIRDLLESPLLLLAS